PIIITLAEDLPSPGTAIVRDLCRGHLMQTRMRLARSSIFFAASVVDDTLGLSIFREPPRGRERETLGNAGARLSISQLLFFDFAGNCFWIILVEDSLKGQPRAWCE